jgi:hypothetical protein
MTNVKRDVATVIAGMSPWWREYRHTRKANRSAKIRGWDSGVLAACELIRRVTDYDEELAGVIHSLLSSKLPVPPDTPAKTEGGG